LEIISYNFLALFLVDPGKAGRNRGIKKGNTDFGRGGEEGNQLGANGTECLMESPHKGYLKIIPKTAKIIFYSIIKNVAHILHNKINYKH
jgi:hypothetical protein